MSHPPNFLRTHRKRSPLTQADIAFLMKLPDESTVSRYEKGLRVPSIELLLLYHHLFDTSIESFFELQSQAILKDLSRDIQCLIEEIQKEELTSKNTLRIKFLEEIIIKLTN